MTTVAGDGEEGSDDGDAMEASFSFPGGIALYYDSSEGLLEERLVTEGAPPATDGARAQLSCYNMLVIDKYCSRVLRALSFTLRFAETITCLCARPGCLFEAPPTTNVHLSYVPHAKVAEPQPHVDCLFWSPSPSISLHPVSGLVLYVADTNNHRLRKISGDVANGAGTVTCHAGR